MSNLLHKEMYDMMLTEYPDVLSFDEMCKALCVSPKTGYTLLRENKIGFIKVGRSFRIPKIYLLQYLFNESE